MEPANLFLTGTPEEYMKALGKSSTKDLFNRLHETISLTFRASREARFGTAMSK
jgi:hypothetical protein